MTTVPFHRRKETKLVFRYLTAASLVVIFVFPIYWLFAISFKTPSEIFAFPPVWYPKSIQLCDSGQVAKTSQCGSSRNA